MEGYQFDIFRAEDPSPVTHMLSVPEHWEISRPEPAYSDQYFIHREYNLC